MQLCFNSNSNCFENKWCNKNVGNLTGLVGFGLEDVRETEGEKQNKGRKHQISERLENIETQKPPLIWWGFGGGRF